MDQYRLNYFNNFQLTGRLIVFLLVKFMAILIVSMRSRNSIEGSEVVTPVAELTLRAN